ncbi:alpha/beta hydrolases superfamily protein [Tanacetum coccineum]
MGKCFRCGDPNHLIGECPKPPRDKNQRAFVGGSWSDSGEENDEKIQDETCLLAQAPNEERIIKSKTSQNRQETEKTSTREKFEERYQSRISAQQEKKVNEDPFEVKRPILTSFKITRALLEVSKFKGLILQKIKVAFKEENKS